MRKAVILAMSAPLIIGPASAALAAVGGTAPTAPTSPTTQVKQAVQPSSSTGSTAPTSTTSQTAQDTTTTPAPPSSSEAKPLDVAGIVSIGHTKAGAGPDGSSATGNAIELGGQVVSGGTASSSGKNKDSGALFDSSTTPLAPLGLIQIAPWTASASQTGQSSTADATASLAHVHLGGGSAPGFIDLLILGSESKADYSPAEATSSSVSDGVLLQVGQGNTPALTVDLLHAEAFSDKKGSSYIAAINGNEIGSSDQANGQCQIPIPQLVTINCLTATGGVAGQLASSAVGTVDFVPSQLPDATVSGTTSKAAPAAATPNTQVEGNKTVNGTGNNGNTGNNGSAGQALPFTGLNAGELTALGGALAAGGMVAMSLGRRRRTQS